LRVLRATFESKFPTSMVFTLDATSSRPIQRATLWYRVSGRRTLVSGDAQIALGPGTVRAQQEFDLTRDYLPPGTQLQYYWELQDDRGARSKSETVQATLEDRRFQWHQLKNGPIEVDWNRGGDDFGRGLMTVATRALNQFGGELGVTLDRPVRILVYGDQSEFQSASFRGGLEWVGGTYYPQENVILLYAPPNQQGAEIARRAIPHELTHAVIHQVTDNPFGDIPQWLNEGLATHEEPQVNEQQADALSTAIAQHKLIPLRALSGAFPVDSDQALLAYAESESAVNFLLDQYGRGKVSELLQVFHEGVTYDDGLRRVLGADQAQIDEQWRAWLAPWPLIKAKPFEGPPPPAPPTAQEALLAWLRSVVDGMLHRGS
jgi:hypothetical protein